MKIILHVRDSEAAVLSLPAVLQFEKDEREHGTTLSGYCYPNGVDFSVMRRRSGTIVVYQQEERKS